MVDAVVGAVIMVVATTSLFLALEVTEDALRAAGRYPLNEDEQAVLENLPISLDDVESQLNNQLPSQYQQSNDL